ncbi:GNAT family N-acetyltransferase [Bacillus shivajii]|uniref:GNAT family N-acetyltransferase n=1 Tax=Bacillus shivajii TaxID=1983719 RepID=UPI001CFA53FA|nr:GNAT family N-acetyltransferase [Bacillus shivajii]UCZ51617.1 GNAT family N-acetyltransferase [Bacillus shivajii]
MIIESERVYIRKFNKNDISSLHAIFSDTETMQYYPSPFSYEKTESWVIRNQERYKQDGFGLWAVCLKDNGNLIGDCGLVKQEVAGNIEVELGYHINKNFWFNGFGTEAALACKNYGFDHFGLNKLISIIDPKNVPSIRVAEKNGFKKEKQVFIFNKIHTIYSCNKKN